MSEQCWGEMATVFIATNSGTRGWLLDSNCWSGQPEAGSCTGI
jgi:hypothetical protein